MHDCISGRECTIFSGALCSPTRDTDVLSRIRCIISRSLFEVSKNHDPSDVSSSSLCIDIRCYLLLGYCTQAVGKTAIVERKKLLSWLHVLFICTKKVFFSFSFFFFLIWRRTCSIWSCCFPENNAFTVFFQFPKEPSSLRKILSSSSFCYSCGLPSICPYMVHLVGDVRSWHPLICNKVILLIIADKLFVTQVILIWFKASEPPS